MLAPCRIAAGNAMRDTGEGRAPRRRPRPRPAARRRRRPTAHAPHRHARGASSGPRRLLVPGAARARRPISSRLSTDNLTKLDPRRATARRAARPARTRTPLSLSRASRQQCVRASRMRSPGRRARSQRAPPSPSGRHAPQPATRAALHAEAGRLSRPRRRRARGARAISTHSDLRPLACCCIFERSRFHMAVARLRSETSPTAAHTSMTSLVGLNCVRMPYSEAA